MSGRRTRLLVFNQYYWPGVEATAHLLSELCAALADEFTITVVAGTLSSPAAPSGRSEHEGVEIVRVRSTAYERSRLAHRALNYVSYLAGALVAGLRQPRPDVVVALTDPPVVADVALAVARRFRAPLAVISQDVFPEAAVAVGRLRNPLVLGTLRALVGLYLRGADSVVAVGETMRDRLVAKGADPKRLRVIPNWVDAEALRPQPRDNEWSRAHALDGEFVVMHSGNVGYAQDLDTLVRAAALLGDVDGLSVVVVGNGARRRELEALARELAPGRVTFLDYQPRQTLALSLSAAAVHVVGLAAGLAGYVVPSRLYGVLAVGRPVLAVADESSELARIVGEVGCGLVVPPGRPEELAAAIREAHEGRHDLDEMGRRGRAYVEEQADRPLAVARYRELFRELAGR